MRSLNQIPAGNLVPTFLWKPPGCKSCLIDWQVWRRGQQSLGGLVVLEGKGPWWDDEERGQAGFRVVVTCHKSLWQLIQIHVTTVTNPCDNIDKNNRHNEEEPRQDPGWLSCQPAAWQPSASQPKPGPLHLFARRVEKNLFGRRVEKNRLARVFEIKIFWWEDWAKNMCTSNNQKLVLV